MTLTSVEDFGLLFAAWEGRWRLTSVVARKSPSTGVTRRLDICSRPPPFWRTRPASSLPGSAQVGHFDHGQVADRARAHIRRRGGLARTDVAAKVARHRVGD